MRLFVGLLSSRVVGYNRVMKKKQQSKKWFVKVRGSYLPNSWQGWLTYVPFVIFLATVFIAVDRNSHSVSDTLYGIFPQWVAAAVVMTWFAKQKS